MQNSTSFAAILQKITTEKEVFSNENSNSQFIYVNEESIRGFSQILGTTPTYRFNFKSTYPQGPQKTKTSAAHEMSDTQKASFNFFILLGLRLTASFNAKEIKSIYRQALLKTHPDHGGSSEKFQDTRKHYEILYALVTNKT